MPNGMSGYFSRNGFHMFEREITIILTSWTSLTNFDNANVDLKITSLYDVTHTQPWLCSLSLFNKQAY